MTKDLDLTEDFDTLVDGLDFDPNSPENKRLKAEDKKTALSVEDKMYIDMIKLINTKELEDKDTGERSLIVTDINTRGLHQWIRKYVPALAHEKLQKPYLYDPNTVLWREVKSLTPIVHETVLTNLDKVLENHFHVLTVPNKMYNDVVKVANAYEKLLVADADETNPLIKVQEPNLVPFANGIYNFDDDSIRPMVKDDYIVSPLPYELIPCDESDENVQYIKSYIEWLVGESAPLIYAYMGFLFYRSQSTVQTIMVFINGRTANGRNGKGKMIELMQALLGNTSKNYSALKMAEIADNSKDFAKKNLQHKFANFDGDAGGSFLKNTETLKGLSSSDTIQANVKNGDYTSFSSYARLVMATNDLPDFRDDSTGLAERWVLVPFIRKVTDDENRKMWNTPDAKFSDENKAKYMFNNESLGKWAWFCIQEYKKLMAKGMSSNPFKALMSQEAETILAGMAYDNDPILQFLSDNNFEVTGNENDAMPKNDLWEMYKEHTDGAVKTKKNFFVELGRKGVITKIPTGKNNLLKAPERRINGKKVYCVLGLKYNAPEELSPEDEFPRLLSNGKTRVVDNDQVAEDLENLFHK